MTKIYIIAAVALVTGFAYWAGGRIADARCRADIEIARAANNITAQTKIIEIKEKTNAETYTTAVADIRHRLRDKYTIAD